MEPAGAQRMAAAVFDHLKNRGHEAEWWSWYLKRPAYEMLPGVHCLSHTPPQSALHYTRILMTFVRRLREFRPDVIFGFTHYANTLGLASGRFAGVPVLIASQQNVRDSYPWLARLADSALGTCGLYSTNVMCSRAVLESFSQTPRRYRADATVIPNGSKQVVRTPTQEDKRQAKESVGVAASEKLVVAIGRLSPQKRHHVLIDTMRRLPGMRLLIAGEGELRPELEALISASALDERVQLIGNLSPDRVQMLLRAADVFAMASEFEGLSLALVEAMAAGLPIVASDIAPIRDVVIDDSGQPAGILLASTSADIWAQSIRSVMTTDQLQQDYGRRARDRARAFDIDRSAVEYVSIAESQVAAC
jgi:glycosyltransferase involved in cell wall biosynthesis